LVLLAGGLMDSSLNEFNFIHAEDSIFIRADDVLKMLELKKSFTKEDIQKLADCFERYRNAK
jgi:hypothetical protein